MSTAFVKLDEVARQKTIEQPKESIPQGARHYQDYDGAGLRWLSTRSEFDLTSYFSCVQAGIGDPIERESELKSMGDVSGIKDLFEKYLAFVENQRKNEPRRPMPKPPAAKSDEKMSPVQSIAGLQTMTAADLCALELPPIHWVVENFLPAGLGTLSGKPKVGKSWLMLDLGLCVAEGRRFLDQYETNQGEVLYIGLEDGPRRLQDRLGKLLGERKAPDTLHLATNLNRLDAGGIEQLEKWLEQHKAAKLIVIDTLGRIRPPGKRNEGLYQSDVSFLAPLQKLSQERNIAIFGVHHDRKMIASDPLDQVSGSTGFTGTADLLALFKRESRGRSEAELQTFSREAEGLEIALSQNPITCQWTYEGTALEARQSTERQQILDVLSENTEPITPKEIADAIRKKVEPIKYLLRKLKSEGLVFQPEYGKYKLASKIIPIK